MSETASSQKTFAEFGLSEPVLAAVVDVGYEVPSPIQARSIPPLLEGRDLVGQAQTGTGKTAAFALPLLSRIDANIAKPQILVLTPTRELALQVGEAFSTYARHIQNFRIVPLYGGQGMDAQLRALKRGVQVIVGTPGRVMDHLRRGTLRLDALRALVLDEADEMLNMGFLEDVEWILEKTPAGRQAALFSATMPDAVRRIAHRHLKNAVEIKIESKTTTVDSVTQRFWPVAGTHKLDALTRILETEDFDGMIVFVRTKNTTVELAEKMEARGYSCAPLNGDMNQALREKTIERLKNKTLDILVATDVAARGLNVERISHVVNFDIPHDTEAYVHRIGRTGRAGRKGAAILFVAPREMRMLRAIERATRQPITQMKLPSREDVADRQVARFKEKIGAVIKSGEDLRAFEDIIESVSAEYEVSPRKVGAALAYMAQTERSPARSRASADTGHARPSGESKSSRGEAPRKSPGSFNEEKSHKKQNTIDRAKNEFVAPRREPRPDAAPRSQRGERRPDPAPAEKPETGSDLELVQYRVEVGRDHGVEAKHLVGAITAEAGLDRQLIGLIQIYSEFSTVDLPGGMPREIFQILKKTRVQDRPLSITVTGEKAHPVLKKRKVNKPARGGSPKKGGKHKKAKRG